VATDGLPGACSTAPVPWNYWGYKTWAFHAYAQRTVFLYDESEIWFDKARRTEPNPGRIARWSARDDDVELGSYHGDDVVAHLFSERQTTRRFGTRPLPLADLGRVVSETFRVRDFMDADFFGIVPKKSYPSSGARHEIDLYVIAFDVLDLKSGIYYYDDYRDTLVDTALPLDKEMVEKATARQGIAEVSPAILVAVCQSERIAWKYRGPRGYLDVYVNVGHSMQNAILSAQSIGLRSWISTAIDTAGLASLLNLEDAEFPTAVLGIGWPEGGRSGPAE
jgi:SagB-type dehydrogenase family enzyme